MRAHQWWLHGAATTRSSGWTRSHSEAQRKRRERINAHLDTLRGLVPSASRMDKAALLGEVVRYVRKLRSEAAGSEAVVPGEGDEVVVEEEEVEVEGCSCDAGERQAARRVKASVCCADRPGLMSELGDAERSVSARAVRAEIATVGGRTRSVLELDVARTAAAGGGSNGASQLPALQAALRAVIMSQEELLAVESYKQRRFSADFA
ncbi:putative transcription factor bHLH107 [Oryza glaberrima]|uniref:putative transcription factor bHLH107 n=1 Tax=Oryza glaberrima TaxID=4538 RepID=UPI00224C3949|nr:putative transcription factor bHLH107 [Oryza glaberrima]